MFSWAQSVCLRKESVVEPASSEEFPAGWGSRQPGCLPLWSLPEPSVITDTTQTTERCLHTVYADGQKILLFLLFQVGSVPNALSQEGPLNQFASVVYQQEPYMTPRTSVLSHAGDVDRKLQKRILSQKDVDQMLASTSRVKAGNDLFRTLGDNGELSWLPRCLCCYMCSCLSGTPQKGSAFSKGHPRGGGHQLMGLSCRRSAGGSELRVLTPDHLAGLLSYTEYLFLLTILTKPHTGFHIAFKMLDVDGNEHVDKKEFLKLKKIIGKSKVRLPKDDDTSPVEEGEGVNTTLQAYFFGKNGHNKLQYLDFCR
ncbi:Calcium uptake protein 2, mitochondrial EF-hand domain-containing family member A1 [Takifugu flavidus]|uniref:Calcium uptake protein 2, mitochondrial EF-hand domain-containing family member A1 n=1 Tax=Takifugu flavidus TaxID=433684 RepID=A0A5C6MG36_9TELE|nr:Calcium uptake protein 2, mitochondrial EF-hand domain-containing family member A1 [Takifugu flavidus]